MTRILSTVLSGFVAPHGTKRSGPLAVAHSLKLRHWPGVRGFVKPWLSSACALVQLTWLYQIHAPQMLWRHNYLTATNKLTSHYDTTLVVDQSVQNIDISNRIHIKEMDTVLKFLIYWMESSVFSKFRYTFKLVNIVCNKNKFSLITIGFKSVLLFLE